MLEVILENPFSKQRYPDEGSLIAVIDTGFEGFVAVPGSVFRDLALNRLKAEKRKVALADGSEADSQGSYASLRIPHLSIKKDGYFETFHGLNEIILGVEALTELRVVLDYCANKVRMEKCP